MQKTKRGIFKTEGRNADFCVHGIRGIATDCLKERVTDAEIRPRVAFSKALRFQLCWDFTSSGALAAVRKEKLGG